MCKTEFTILADEVLNEFDCKLESLSYNTEGICKVNYISDDGFHEGYFYTAYRFMNRARLRLKIMNELELLEPFEPGIDLGF